MKLTTYEERKMQELEAFLAVKNNATTESVLEYLKQFLLNTIREVREDAGRAVKSKVGFLRQWLNEDRTTDPKKMVDNQQIEFWLGLAESPNTGE